MDAETKKEIRLCTMLDGIGTFIMVVTVSVILGLLFGMDIVKTRTRAALNGAGIKAIVRCNNAQSNWYEIVWFDKK